VCIPEATSALNDRKQNLFMENSWSIYGYLCSHKKKNREILAIFPPNPQDNRKERNHERLGKNKKQLKKGKTETICREDQEVYTSDFCAV